MVAADEQEGRRHAAGDEADVGHAEIGRLLELVAEVEEVDPGDPDETHDRERLEDREVDPGPADGRGH